MLVIAVCGSKSIATAVGARGSLEGQGFTGNNFHCLCKASERSIAKDSHFITDVATCCVLKIEALSGRAKASSCHSEKSSSSTTGGRRDRYKRGSNSNASETSIVQRQTIGEVDLNVRRALVEHLTDSKGG